MKKTLFLLSLSMLLWTCNKDNDPGPDLTSSSISFLWDTDPGSGSKYYAVISDTSGNILQWAELEDNKKTGLPYPPDNNLAVVTIITRVETNSGYKSTRMTTMTNVPAGDYSYTEDSYELPFPDNYYTLNISERSNYGNFIPAVTPQVWYSYEDLDDGTQKYSLGLYDNIATNQLFVTGASLDNPTSYKYLHVTGIKGGEERTITPDDFENEFIDMPGHVLTYPEHSEMSNSLFVLYGISEASQQFWGIYINQFTGSQVPVIAYPVIDGLFDSYETVSLSFKGFDMYTTDITTDQPVTTFSTLEASFDAHKEVTTKRVSLDVSGDGSTIYLAGTYGVSNDLLEYHVFAPKTPKVRVNLPQFTQELIEKIPNLSSIQEKSFNTVSIDDYNMSYNDYVKFRMSSVDYDFPLYLKSVTRSVGNLDNGRISAEGNFSEVLHRYGKNKGIAKQKF